MNKLLTLGQKGEIFFDPEYGFGPMIHPVVFYSLMVLTLGCAIAVVSVNNIFHAGLFLIGSFLGVAGLYVGLHNFFLAAVQLLIYSGAIAVLILFGIMMTHRPKTPEEPSHNSMWLAGILLAALALKILLANYDLVRWGVSRAAGGEMLFGIGQMLMQASLLPFEIISVVLLAALIGAVALAKEKDEG